MTITPLISRLLFVFNGSSRGLFSSKAFIVIELLFYFLTLSMSILVFKPKILLIGKTFVGKTIFQLMRDKVYVVSLSLVWKDGEANKFQFYKQNKLCFETVY
jgi:hypothetical protein